MQRGLAGGRVMGLDGDNKAADSGRLFFGFRPPAQVSALLARVMRTCEGFTNGACVSERPVNLHMTLCYLGDVQEDLALGFLHSVVPALPQPSFGFAELGFSRGGHLWALWHCLRATASLEALRAQCQAALHGQQTKQVGKHLLWLPHVTLAKRVLPLAPPLLPGTISDDGSPYDAAIFLRLLNDACAPELRELSRLQWSPHEITLWSSVRHRIPGKDYETRAHVPLPCGEECAQD